MGILSGLRSDPVGTLIVLLYQIPAILIALTLNELAHGYVAYRCGDPTAQMMGRLTFNPLKHLDPIGTLFMVLFGFGWARPVPVNPRNYKRFRRDDLLVSIAGVAMNFCLFFFVTALMIGLNQLMWKPEVWALGSLTTPREFLGFEGVNFYSILSGDETLIVEKATQYVQSVSGNQAYLSLLTPQQFRGMGIAYSGGGDYYFTVDALSTYLRFPWMIYLQRFFMFFARINLSLAVFNLLPIPPLDGSKILAIVLPDRAYRQLMQYERYGFLILMGLLFLGWLDGPLTFLRGGLIRGIIAITEPLARLITGA